MKLKYFRSNFRTIRTKTLANPYTLSLRYIPRRHRMDYQNILNAINKPQGADPSADLARRTENYRMAEQLNQESASLRQNQRVNAFLDAELALCRLMQRICRTLVAGIDIQIPDL